MVKLLVLAYRADPDSYAVRKNEFPVLLRLPLYAAMQAGVGVVCSFCNNFSCQGPFFQTGKMATRKEELGHENVHGVSISGIGLKPEKAHPKS